LTPQSVTLDNKQITALSTALQAAEINLHWLTADDARATLGLPRAMVKILER
jgi:A/G-specific adenine glycosylase